MTIDARTDAAARTAAVRGTAARVRKPLLLGARGSTLAVTQARWVALQLTRSSGRPVQLVRISTPGDESDAPIEQIGTTGVFVTALRDGLLDGQVDLVVHSCKDLPAAPVPGVLLAAFPPREDPRDALIGPGGGLDDLPRGARIGTGSPRRAAQLLATGLEPVIVPIRGNVDTRLRKLATGEVDGLLLAMAGLSRLGRLSVASVPLDPSVMMPAPTQGVLAIECRQDDPATATLVAELDHAPTRAVAIAERGFLAALDAGCTAPVGALGELLLAPGEEPAVRLTGIIAAPDGSSILRAQVTGALARGAETGHRLAHILLADGGAELLDRPGTAVDPRSRPWPPPKDLARGDKS